MVGARNRNIELFHGVWTHKNSAAVAARLQHSAIVLERTTTDCFLDTVVLDYDRGRHMTLMYTDGHQDQTPNLHHKMQTEARDM